MIKRKGSLVRIFRKNPLLRRKILRIFFGRKMRRKVLLRSESRGVLRKLRSNRMKVKMKIYDGDRRDIGRSGMSFLCGMMMKSGNRRQVECRIDRVIRRVRREVSCNVDGLMNGLISKLVLRVGLFKRRISGTSRSIPMLLPEYKSFRGGWKRFVRGVRGRYERGIEEKMYVEIMEMLRGSGNSIKVKREDSFEIRKGKVWLKYLRR